MWLERLTDDSNLWLSAVRLEEKGELWRAILAYLEDSAKCLDEGRVVGAALGGACAADCFCRVGDLESSRRLYHLAGMLYWENADDSIGRSIRESIWSLQEARECFSLAREDENARDAELLFYALARRANPFIGDREIFMLGPAPRTQRRQARSIDRPAPQEISTAIEGLFRSREAQKLRSDKLRQEPPPVVEDESDSIDAQGFASQLG